MLEHKHQPATISKSEKFEVEKQVKKINITHRNWSEGFQNEKWAKSVSEKKIVA